MERIFIIGGTTFDHIVSLPEFPQPVPQTIHQASFHETTGSTGSGKSICLTKLGVPNTLYSILGDDSYGLHIIHHLRKEKVDFIYDFDPKGTERHINIMDAHGSRISIFVTQSSEFPEVNLKLIEDVIQKSNLIVLNIIAYCKKFIPLLSQYSKPVWTDLHDYTDGNVYHQPFIDAADIIFLSSDNLSNYKQTMQNLINKGKEMVVCTHGKNGASLVTMNGMWIDEPALTDFVITDTNGAGDNFFAGFLYAYLKGKPLKECMKYGTLAAAYCITSSQLVSEKLTSAFLEQEYTKIYNGQSY
jgi:acarbose 7IV-phosphotransferase